MDKRKELVYMVSYHDDNNRKHLTFVKDVSVVKFLRTRYDVDNYGLTDSVDPTIMKKLG